MILLKLCFANIIGDDGFQFTSVSVGTHNITVIGNLDGTSEGPLTISGLEVVECFVLQLLLNVQGTGFILTIIANQEANFVCRLDGETDFEPCK